MLEHNDLGIAFGCKEGEIWIPKVRSVTDNCINKTERKKKNIISIMNLKDHFYSIIISMQQEKIKGEHPDLY